jgi:hypothetical protein
MKQPPCRDCPEKGCGEKHDSCEEYQEWKAEIAKERERSGEESRIRGDIANAVQRNMRRNK